MKYPALILIFLTLTFVCQAQIVTEVDSLAKPDLLIYVSADSSQADLFVYQLMSTDQVTRDGEWKVTLDTASTEFRFQLVSDPKDADLRIYYVNDRARVGWQNNTRRYIYHHKRNEE